MWRSNASNRFSPPYDVIELKDRIIIVVEVAGIKAEDVKINLTDKRLVIHGVRKRPDFTGAANHRMEIGYGEFGLDISLSWFIKQQAVSASYRDGFLQVELPRQPEKQIRVVSGADKEKQDKAADDE